MKNIFKHSLLLMGTASVMLVSTGCKKNFTNPNAATSDQVFSSATGLTGVAVSLQRTYALGRAGSLYNIIAANGFTTGELILLNAGNTAEYQLSVGGGSVDGTNSILANIWANANKIEYDANNVIDGASKLNDKNYASGLIGYASLYKALALGSMAMYWEKVPAAVGANATFVDRKEGFVRAIATIDAALAAISANAISAAFTANIPAGNDIVNSLQALKARYALFSGNNALALTAANAVDLTKRSTMNYDAVSLNPIFETATSTNNVFQPVDSTFGLPVGLAPAATDRRIAFYTSINPTIAPRFRIAGFGAASATAFPVYLPGEITLIKAEVYARNNDLANALTELNKVVTKTAASDPFAVGAGLPALTGTFTQAQLLDQIYSNRCIELFMSGLKLEDMRRFGRATTERKRNLFPYPFRERDNNKNTPADPTF
jgi:starch-binding outer membrane protein, SusD/RagB family